MHCLDTITPQALSTQIESVQENLMLLTILENKQKELEDHVIADVRVQRQEMAGLLTSLMEAQHERRLELEEATRQIEDQYQDELANFWLYQYQMLMAAKPAKVLTEEEEALRAASKATKLEKPLQGEEYQGPAVCGLYPLNGCALKHFMQHCFVCKYPSSNVKLACYIRTCSSESEGFFPNLLHCLL